MHKSLFWTLPLGLILATSCQHESQRIVVIKYATHPALDELEHSVLRRLRDAVSSDPALKGVYIDRFDANGNPQRAKQLAVDASRPDVLLIVAIATPAAQAVAQTKSLTPLLYGAVADPTGAGILPSNRATGIQNVGPSIVARAIQFITAAFPAARTIGTVYNPGEQNSVFVQTLLTSECKRAGLSLIQQQVTDPATMSALVNDLARRVDVIYSANDNTVNAGVASVVAVTRAGRKPFIIGDLSTLSSGALAAVGLNYGEMGDSLGAMAVRILRGTPVATIPPRPAPLPQVWVNTRILSELGIILPATATALVDSVIR